MNQRKPEKENKSKTERKFRKKSGQTERHSVNPAKKAREKSQKRTSKIQTGGWSSCTRPPHDDTLVGFWAARESTCSNSSTESLVSKGLRESDRLQCKRCARLMFNPQSTLVPLPVRYHTGVPYLPWCLCNYEKSHRGPLPPLVPLPVRYHTGVPYLPWCLCNYEKSHRGPLPPLVPLPVRYHTGVPYLPWCLCK